LVAFHLTKILKSGWNPQEFAVTVEVISFHLRPHLFKSVQLIPKYNNKCYLITQFFKGEELYKSLYERIVFYADNFAAQREFEM